MGNEPTHLDLFSGIGGFALAAQWAGFRTIGFCEIDKYCQKILANNFLADTRNARSSRAGGESQSKGLQQQSRNGHPEIISNIFDLNGRDFAGVSLITGGFPCQPFSVAGKRRGAADDRAIWPEMFRVISEARPAWVLGENVPGIIPMELDNVLSDLEGIGYATRPFNIGAVSVDARHRRQRIWIIGKRIVSDTSELQCNGGKLYTRSDIQGEDRRTSRKSGNSRPTKSIPNAYQQELEGQREQSCGTGTQLNDTGDHCRWESEPDVGRVAHGIPSRVDRLKGLGNAIVPQVACEILLQIRKLI
jgi:DNA (cytosine-5)-methyltransferase 1